MSLPRSAQRVFGVILVDALLPDAASALVVAVCIALRNPAQRVPVAWLGGALGCIGLAAAIVMASTWRPAGGGSRRAVGGGARVAAALLAGAAVVIAQQVTAAPALAALAVLLACLVSVEAVGEWRLALGAGAVVTGGATWCVWHSHLTAGAALQVSLLYCCAALSVGVVTWRAMRVSNELANSRDGLAALDDVVSSATSAMEGLRAGIGYIRGVVPTDHVVVLARGRGERAAVPIATWPHPESGDAELGVMVGLEEALGANKVVSVGRHSFLPIGYSGTEQLALAIRHDRRGGPAPATEEATERVAACLLKLTARASFMDELRRESRTDPLTGLANRRELLARLEVEMHRAERLRSPLAVAMIDLDHFKVYNDRFGHVGGDNLLRAVAATFVSSIRGQDLVARFGGEEFVIVLPDTDLSGANVLMDRLRGLVRNVDPANPVSISVGLAAWDGTVPLTELIARADQALYRAKSNGRDQVVLHGV